MSLMDPRHSDNDPVLYSATAGGDKYIPCSPSLFSPSLDMVNGGDVGIRDEMTPIINDANEAIDSTPYASSRNRVRSELSACSIRDFDEDDQRLAESFFRSYVSPSAGSQGNQPLESSLTRSPNNDEVGIVEGVVTSLRLRLNYNNLVNDPKKREAFRLQFIIDVSTALKLMQTQVVVLRVECGSVIVHFELRATSSEEKQELMHSLRTQVSDPSSHLRKGGRITCQIDPDFVPPIERFTRHYLVDDGNDQNGDMDSNNDSNNELSESYNNLNLTAEQREQLRHIDRLEARIAKVVSEKAGAERVLSWLSGAPSRVSQIVSNVRHGLSVLKSLQNVGNLNKYGPLTNDLDGRVATSNEHIEHIIKILETTHASGTISPGKSIESELSEPEGDDSWEKIAEILKSNAQLRVAMNEMLPELLSRRHQRASLLRAADMASENESVAHPPKKTPWDLLYSFMFDVSDPGTSSPPDLFLDDDDDDDNHETSSSTPSGDKGGIIDRLQRQGAHFVMHGRGKSPMVSPASSAVATETPPKQITDSTRDYANLVDVPPTPRPHSQAATSFFLGTPDPAFVAATPAFATPKNSDWLPPGAYRGPNGEIIFPPGMLQQFMMSGAKFGTGVNVNNTAGHQTPSETSNATSKSLFKQASPTQASQTPLTSNKLNPNDTPNKQEGTPRRNVFSPEMIHAAAAITPKEMNLTAMLGSIALKKASPVGGGFFGRNDDNTSAPTPPRILRDKTAGPPPPPPPPPPPRFGGGPGGPPPPPPPPGGIALPGGGDKNDRSRFRSLWQAYLKQKNQSNRKGRATKVGSTKPAAGGTDLQKSLKELMGKSSYSLQIAKDTDTYGDQLLAMKAEIDSAAPTTMMELVALSQRIETLLSYLSDETQVLKNVENWPFDKVECIRELLSRQSMWTDIFEALTDWEIEAERRQDSFIEEMNKITMFFSDTKLKIEQFRRDQNSIIKKYENYHIKVDVVSSVRRLEELTIILAKRYMTLSIGERGRLLSRPVKNPMGARRISEKIISMLRSSFEFSFRVNQFANKEDPEATSLFEEIFGLLQDEMTRFREASLSPQ